MYLVADVKLCSNAVKTYSMYSILTYSKESMTQTNVYYEKKESCREKVLRYPI